MKNLNLKGPLNLMGNLTLTPPSQGKVIVNNQEALVVMMPAPPAHHGTAPSVIQPPPPAIPADAGTDVWVINSLNQTVRIGQRAIVTQGFVIQGNVPTWPGMVLPSQINTGPTAVTINRISINVLGDQASIFPSGGIALLNAASGQ